MTQRSKTDVQRVLAPDRVVGPSSGEEEEAGRPQTLESEPHFPLHSPRSGGLQDFRSSAGSRTQPFNFYCALLSANKLQPLRLRVRNPGKKLCACNCRALSLQEMIPGLAHGCSRIELPPCHPQAGVRTRTCEPAGQVGPQATHCPTLSTKLGGSPAAYLGPVGRHTWGTAHCCKGSGQGADGDG